MVLILELGSIVRNYPVKTKVLEASVRHPRQVVEAAKIGGDICTMPFAVFKQLVQHPLTDIGLKKFLADWEKQNVPRGQALRSCCPPGAGGAKSSRVSAAGSRSPESTPANPSGSNPTTALRLTP